MEPTSGVAICLICFKTAEKHIFVPSDTPAKIFGSCNTYLHSTITKDALKNIQLNNENQLPMCKSCFDSALQLTKLSELLTTVQKDISDLTVAFSMKVFHRRSQVYNFNQTQDNNKSSSNSLLIEFNESCLPPNLFSTEYGNQNIHHNNNGNQYNIVNSLQTETDITNVKFESSVLQFDNLPENRDRLFENDNNAEKQCINEDVDEHFRRHATERNTSACISEMTIVHVAGGNDSKNCKDPKSGKESTMSDLLKSVKMPKIILEKIKTEGHLVDATVGNSNKTNGNPGKNMLRDDVFHDSSNIPTPSFSGGKNRLKCFYCEKTFARKGNRSIHYRTHTGEKPFECMLCKKRFASSGTLKDHGRTHTGEKPYQCSLCEERFAQRRTLKNHERTHTGEKPYQCSLCNNRFIQIGHLKRHEKTHTGDTPFECMVCKKRFATSGSVKVHERTHTKEKPYQCTLCQARFAQRRTLKNHERIHTTETHFKL